MSHLPRRQHQLLILCALLSMLVLVGITPATVHQQPSKALFGYSRVTLPLVVTSAPTPPPPAVTPQIIVWLDIPGRVRINDRMQIVVNIKNEGSSDFDGRTVVTIPYDNYKFFAASTSLKSDRGDWVRENRFPNDLVVEFGPVKRGEERRGVIYYDFRANGADAQVGDSLRIRARYTNGNKACGQSTCSTNQRYVEVTSEFASSGNGTLPPGSRQIQKLGSIRYNETRRWAPEGFRPGEQVVTWLNVYDDAAQSLTMVQKADDNGRVDFNIDGYGRRNGFYSIVAHGNDTGIEIVGEFEIIGSPRANSASAAQPMLIPLPAPAMSLSQDPTTEQFSAAPAQVAGDSVISGVAAAIGTNGATRLEDVLVSIIAADGSIVGASPTDVFGGYLITSIPSGTYTVCFDPRSARGATTRRYQPLTQANITIPASGRVQLDAELILGSSVSGTVTGASVGALEGVSVLLLSGNTVIGTATTGADGRYRIDGVPAGTYKLQFDPAAADTENVRAFAVATSSDITVVAPAPLSGQNIALSRASDTGEIAGQIVAAADGSPLGEVFVLFERQNPTTSNYEYAGLAISDETGAYSGVLPPGRYRVSFRPGFSDNPDSARYLRTTFGADIILAGGVIDHADVALALGGTIAGTITGDSGPLAGVMVEAYDSTSGNLAGLALTDADGTYRTNGMPVGSYQLQFVTFFSESATTLSYAGAARTEPVTIGSTANVTGIDAQLALGGAIAGSVSGAADIPLANVLVLGLNTNGTATADDDTLDGLTLTNADGSYTLPGLTTGSYVVAFITEFSGTPDVAAYLDEYYDDTTTYAAASQVAVTAGTSVTGINATLALGGQIRGRVSDETSGSGLEGVLIEVYAFADPTTLVAFGITDDQGNYATTALTTGISYIIRFDPVVGGGASAYAAEYYNNAASSATAQQVAVPSTATVTGVDVGLSLLP